MYEHRHDPLISPREFVWRLATHGGFALVLIAVSLAIGILGYHFLEGLSWIDSLVNASMLLGGMGPVNPLTTVAGKIFASFYALYSGLVFLVVAGVMIVPIFHRFLHHFHLEQIEKEEAEN